MTGYGLPGKSPAYSFVYNNNGDLEYATFNGNLSTLTYDYDDNLTGISSAAETVAYAYDALGRRIYREDTAGLMHTFVYDGSNLVAEYNDGTGTWDTQYTYGYDMLDKQGTGGTEYPLYNGQGDVFQTLTQSGSYILSDDISDDFGQHFGGTTGTDDLMYKWRASSGYRWDGDGLWTGSYNEPIVEVGARYYIPAMGVFITRDKNLGQRPYEYCGADPVNNDDPTGYDIRSTQTSTQQTLNPQGTGAADPFGETSGDTSGDDPPSAISGQSNTLPNLASNPPQPIGATPTVVQPIPNGPATYTASGQYANGGYGVSTETIIPIGTLGSTTIVVGIGQASVSSGGAIGGAGFRYTGIGLGLIFNFK